MSGAVPTMQALKTRAPAMPPGLVHRTSLSERLTAGAQGSVTLVTGSPGAGKTLTVGSWAVSGDQPGPVGWLTLDDADNDLGTFWSDLLVAVIASGAVPSESRLRDITPAAGFGPAEAREIRLRLAELPSSFVLVLDDFHEIENDDVLDTFGELVDHLPPQVRLVIVGRSDPVLGLHRLRVSGQLTEIRTADLAFASPETVDLFDGAGIRLASAQADRLTRRTQGWPAGLRLAALSMDPDDVDGGIERFSGNDRSVADYLLSEVTRRLSPRDRDFVLWTSVVDRVSGALADHVTGRTDSQAVLDGFVRANAFVVNLGGNDEWFSYHPLLRELMRHRLRLEQPHAETTVHLRAAEWLTSHGQPIEALRHLILGGDEAAAGRAMLSLGPKLVTPEGPALAAAVQPLAAAAIDHPSLFTLLASAFRHFQRHEYHAMEQDATEARHFLPTGDALMQAADEEIRASAEVVILLFEMTGARIRAATPVTAELATEVISIISSTPRVQLPSGRAFRIIAQGNLGGAQLWNGQPAQAERLLTAVDTEASELGLLLAQLNATSHLALVEAMRGDFRAAHRRAKAALVTIERRGWGSEPQGFPALLSLALVELARQQPDAADRYVTRGLAAGGRETDRAIRLALAIAAVQVAVGRGDRDAAAAADDRMLAGFGRTPDAGELLVRWAAVAGAEAALLAGRPAEAVTRIGTPGEDGGFASSWERVALARAKVALGEFRAAQVLIEPLLLPGSRVRDAVVAAQVLRSLLEDHLQRDVAALAAVTAAIDAAQPEGITRPFHLIGGRIPDLLRRYLQLGGRHQSFAGDLLTNLGPSSVPAEPAAPIVDRLTDRETIVLRYLPTMLKAGEIADELYVSVNTVKAHLRSIYRKLGVVSRREAVDKAKAAGLL